MPTAPFRFSGAEVRPGKPAGPVAADTAEVLAEVLGLDDAEVTALHEAGVVHGARPDHARGGTR
jgi:CoA:oxalate CoA-transferase